MTDISALASVTRVALVSGGNISSTEHNTWSTNVITQLNAMGTPTGLLSKLESNWASASQPTDKPAGKEWWDSGNNLLKIYNVLNGTPVQVLTAGDATHTGVTQFYGSGGTALYSFPDVAARTINVSGVDQAASYADATGTASAGVGAAGSFSRTIKANSLNGKPRKLRFTILFKSTGTAPTGAGAAIYFGANGSNADTAIITPGTCTNGHFFIATIIIEYLTAITYNAFGEVSDVTVNNEQTKNALINQAIVGTGFTIDNFLSVYQPITANSQITTYSVTVEPLG